MKLMVCANPGIGRLPDFDLPVEKLSTWQRDCVLALKRALADAKEKGAQACFIAGGLFCEGFVPQSLVDVTVSVLSGAEIPIWVAQGKGETKLPGDIRNVVLVQGDEKAVPIDDLGVWYCCRRDFDVPHNAANTKFNILVERVRDEVDILFGEANREKFSMGPVEPYSFECALPSGYCLLDSDNPQANPVWVRHAIHPTIVVGPDIDGSADTKKLVASIKEKVKDIDRSACVRIELRGKVKLGVYYNPVALENSLSDRFYYAEIVDLCFADVDADELELDVSLLAEFVRQVMSDDSLSKPEQTRILRCGWNVLNGKRTIE